MKDKDKINQFFVQRLGDDTPGDDGWNMPSDDIFESAKLHFPKKKEKKRPFLFWLSGGVVVAMVLGLGLYSFFGDTDLPVEIKSVNNIESKINSNENTIVKSIDQKDEIKSIKEERKESIIKKDNVSIPKKKVANRKHTDKVIKRNPSVFQDNPGRNVSWQNTKSNKSMSSTTTNEKIEKSTEDNSNTRFAESAPIINKKERTVIPILPILNKENNLDELEADSKKSHELPLEAVNADKFKARTIQKWEIGLTHARFMLPFNKIVLKDEDAKETLSFNVKTKNLNIPITRRLNRRWSLTSGYSYADIDLDIDVTKQLIYDTNATEDKVETLVDEIIRDGAIGSTVKLNDQSRAINLEFVDNLDLENGDILDINAKIPVRIKLHQIPLLVNFHLGNKKRNRKFEWILHAGPAIEYFELEIPFFEMSAYESNNLLTHSVEFDPITEAEIAFAVLAGGGVKYHINNHFNIGLNTKIDVFAIPAARYELGLFYGFKVKNKHKSMMQF